MTFELNILVGCPNQIKSTQAHFSDASPQTLRHKITYVIDRIVFCLTYLLPDPDPQVEKIVDVAEVNQRRCLKESEHWLEYGD